MLVDSHCHLDRLDLFGGSSDVAEVLENARRRGVSRFLAIGVDMASSAGLIGLARRFADVHVSVGVHPLQDEAQPVPSVERLVDLAGDERVVAIGETGLDYHYAESTRRWQQESFVNHLDAARSVKKPVVVHTRSAQKDTLGLIADHADQETGGVLHCFTESWEMAKAALDMNFLISFSGIITFRNASALREVVKKVPLDRLLVETDSPWLAPVPYRGKANVPGYVVEVARQVADVKGIAFEEVAHATTENFCRLFKV
ncbi:MAG: TatD family hydrolase [Porticoccaceae bacterium]